MQIKRYSLGGVYIVVPTGGISGVRIIVGVSVSGCMCVMLVGRGRGKMQYHIETFREYDLATLTDKANAYLEECQELEVEVLEAKLSWQHGAWVLLVLMWIP